MCSGETSSECLFALEIHEERREKLTKGGILYILFIVFRVIPAITLSHAPIGWFVIENVMGWYLWWNHCWQLSHCHFTNRRKSFCVCIIINDSDSLPEAISHGSYWWRMYCQMIAKKSKIKLTIYDQILSSNSQTLAKQNRLVIFLYNNWIL